MAELEEKLAQLEQEIAANAGDYTKVTAPMDTQAKTQQELIEATERWLFLQGKWEQIQAQKVILFQIHLRHLLAPFHSGVVHST
ncbi:MAG: ABC transporter C-terminal domain-containing protein [Christensenellales bacterium]